MGSTNDQDPLTLAMAPPPNETPDQRQARLASEADAKRRSDEIDEQIRQEREAARRKNRPVKLLLLGQSESGKTTTLKNFQLNYAREEWTEERESWRAVIFLNLVRNVNTILEHLDYEMTDPSVQNGYESTEDLVHTATGLPPLKFEEHHALLRMRLWPLNSVQKDLEEHLGAASKEVHFSSVTTASPFDNASSGRKVFSEFSVRSDNGWKSALHKLRTLRDAQHAAQNSHLQRKSGKEDEIAEIISACRDDIRALWSDPVVHQVLDRKKIRLDTLPGFFINDVQRIARRDYKPTDDDVIRARLRTLGVQEYKYVLDYGRAAGQEWLFYDVGGSRNSRPTWYSYFDDADAIIFLAPISAFDERLTEDRKVNRLEDSYLLWKSICSCKLLERAQMILFLNKCDILRAKLERGVRLRDYIPSFGDRTNDFATAQEYFKTQFRRIATNMFPKDRQLYLHMTSVIDTRSMSVTLRAMQDSILRQHLKIAALM